MVKSVAAMPRSLAWTAALFLLLGMFVRTPVASDAWLQDSYSTNGSPNASTSPVLGREDAAFQALVVDADPDWPQVQHDPQRSGYTPEEMGPTFQRVWTHPFQPEKVYPQVQVIVYQGKAFIGTEMGNMYALDAKTGDLAWVYSVASPILASVAAGADRVYFGAMDGAVYALNADTGSLTWRAQLDWRLGFSTAPVYAANKVMLGGRNGIFYALDPASGVVVWEYDVGSPVLQTAAWNAGKVYFGAMDMRVYALGDVDGSLAWRTEKLAGMAFKDYWPVVHSGHILIRVMGLGSLGPGFPFSWYGSASEWDWLATYGSTIASGELADVSDAMNVQESIRTQYLADPSDFELSLYVIDEQNGSLDLAVPHWSVQTMNGGTTPPCVDRDGLLIVPVYFIRSGWGRLDLTSGLVTDILYDNRDSSGGSMDAGDIPAGMGNRDENMNVTCLGSGIVAMHTEEYNANYTGYFDQDQRTWYRIQPGQTNWEMSTNTQGGGGNPASAADGILYHISYHELIARQTVQ